MSGAMFCDRCGLYMWTGICECIEHTEDWLNKWAKARWGQYGWEFDNDDQED